MNVTDEIKSIKQKLSDIGRRLSSVRAAAGGGESNTASNQGVGGIGLYDSKVGVDLQFRNINAESNKISVAHDVANKKVDIDVAEGNIKLDDLGTPDNNADLNSTLTEHGLLKILDNDPTHYMDGQGNWTVPAGGGGGSIAFLDNFADGARHWGWFDDANNGAITEAAGVLTLSIANGIHGRIVDGGVVEGPFALLGDPGAPFEVKVKLNDYIVNDRTHAGIFVVADCTAGANDDWCFFGRVKESGAAIDGLGVQTDGAWKASNAVTTLPIYLRFRFNILSKAHCARCECAYSTDDISYTVLYTWDMSSLPNSYLENLAVGIFARNGVGIIIYNAISAPFEWFKMERTIGPG